MRAELEVIRRSLAMSDTLPRSEIERLIEACDRLLTEREHIETILRQLGPAWSDARAALNELAAVLRRP
jgi:hypothetical protein